MKIKLILFLIFITFSIKAQHILSNNLVPNYSFEDYTQCPISYSQIDFAYPWTSTRGISSSTDFLNFCTNNSLLLYFILKNNPHSGLGCGGVFLMDNPSMYDNYREYLSVKLKIQLFNSKKYCCNFYTVLSAGYGAMAIENLDMFFIKIGLLILRNYNKDLQLHLCSLI